MNKTLNLYCILYYNMINMCSLFKTKNPINVLKEMITPFYNNYTCFTGKKPIIDLFYRTMF
jgi:hypothetical protein